jgi:hypothetical protein
MSLKYTYQVIHKVCCCCIVTVGDVQFVNLGLEKGQTELNDIQKAWFDKNEDEVLTACLAVAKEKPASPDYYKAVKWKHRILDRFCKECKIVDT